MSSGSKNVRHRFTVPEADIQVNQWIESQSNLGFSLRVLIKNFVRDYGYQDATCLEFGAPAAKRGRPPKALKQNMEDAFSDVQDDMSAVQPARQEQTFVSERTAGLQGNMREQSVRPVHNTAKPQEDDPADILNGLAPARPAAQPAALQSTQKNIGTDDDGFIDPESLLK